MDAGFAMLASSIFNAQGIKRNDGRPFEPADFLLRWGKGEQEEMTAEQAFQMFQGLAKRNK